MESTATTNPEISTEPPEVLVELKVEKGKIKVKGEPATVLIDFFPIETLKEHKMHDCKANTALVRRLLEMRLKRTDFLANGLAAVSLCVRLGDRLRIMSIVDVESRLVRCVTIADLNDKSSFRPNTTVRIRLRDALFVSFSCFVSCALCADAVVLFHAVFLSRFAGVSDDG